MAIVDLLVVQLGDRRVALHAATVLHVIPAAAIAPLPGAPGVVEGVLNVRGTLVPVLDLRTRFAMQRVPVDPDQHFIVAEAGERRVALRVDRARDFVRIESDNLESAEHVVPGVRHASALARLPDGVLVIHDLEHFLSLDEARALDEAFAQAEPTVEQDGSDA